MLKHVNLVLEAKFGIYAAYATDSSHKHQAPHFLAYGCACLTIVFYVVHVLFLLAIIRMLMHVHLVLDRKIVIYATIVADRSNNHHNPHVLAYVHVFVVDVLFGMLNNSNLVLDANIVIYAASAADWSTHHQHPHATSLSASTCCPYSMCKSLRTLTFSI